MELIWNDYLSREDLEIEPGVIDEDAVQELTMNTYLNYIREFIELGGNEFPDISWDQMENVMVDVFICRTHVFEDRYPEPEEIMEYIKRSENVETRQCLTYLCVHANKDNWPNVERYIKEQIPATERLKILSIREENERAKREKPEWYKRIERDGYIEL